MGQGSHILGCYIFDISLESGAQIEVPIQAGWNGFCYVYEGEIFSKLSVSKGNLAILNNEGTFICKALKNKTQFILVAGMPLNEPVARGGPFVMNTRSEILQAFEDYQNGRLG